MPRGEAHRVRCHLGTEFGRLLTPLVVQTPGARAAVLSDIQGDAIDFVHDETVTALDVQILGAQIGQTVFRLHRQAARHRLPDPTVLVEAEAGSFITSLVGGTYVVALMLWDHANVAAALDAFSVARPRMARLLA